MGVRVELEDGDGDDRRNVGPNPGGLFIQNFKTLESL